MGDARQLSVFASVSHASRRRGGPCGNPGHLGLLGSFPISRARKEMTA